MLNHADRLAQAIRLVVREHLRSPVVRGLARELAALVLEEAERIESQACPDGSAEPAAGADEGDTPTRSCDEPTGTTCGPNGSAHTAALDQAERGTIDYVPLKLGDATASVAVKGSLEDLEAARRAAAQADASGGNGSIAREEVDLDVLVERSRLKADACRLHLRQRAAKGDPLAEARLIDEMNRMIDRAKSLPSCFLWMFWRYGEQPNDDQLETIAANYEALAEAAALCGELVQSKDPLVQNLVAQAFQMMAEASSALRKALAWTWLTEPDADQDQAHRWLRQQTWDRRIFIERHMKLSDPGDPSRAPKLLAEIRSLSAQIRDRSSAVERIEQVLNRLRYHVQRIPEQGPADGHDCRRINECVEELLALGLPGADARLRIALQDLRLDAFPADVPASELVSRIIAGEPEQTAPGVAEMVEPKWSPRVLEARKLLAGGSIVVIGGEPRQDAARRLKDAFALERVEWVSLTEHGSSEPIRNPILRPGTRLVFIIVKLSGHLHAEKAREYAREAGVKVVNLPGGFSPEQVAEQVLSQASDRLEEEIESG